jgi:phosphoglycerate kinase
VSEAVSGYLMKNELQYLDEAVSKPQRPFVAILGGAKVSDKVEVIENLMGMLDVLIIGGGMAYTFFKAMGLEIGNSLLDEDTVEVAGRVLAAAERQSGLEVLLPVDCVVVERVAADAQTRVVSRDQIPDGWEGVDIGPETRQLFQARIEGAGTVIWNGPLGVFEIEAFAKGTQAIAETLERATWESGVISIIGGGDTAAAVKQAGAVAKMSHVSTGGGASLECLAGRVLPGVEALASTGS